MIGISFESELLIFFYRVPLFIVQYKLLITTMTSDISCPKTVMYDVKKVQKVLISLFGVIISSQRSKRFSAVIGSNTINLRLTYTDFPENITSKASIIMGHATVVQKGSEQRICQKTKRKRKEDHFGPSSINC